MGILAKKYEGVTDNPLIRISVAKKENRTTFKIKTGYDFQLLTLERWDYSLGSTKSKITKDQNGENVFSVGNYWSIISLL